MKVHNPISRKRTIKWFGRGLINKLINRLPFEIHLPGYNYCGPGTKLEKRIARGDKGINELDEACKEHDIVYYNTNSLKERHIADQRLRKTAKKIINKVGPSFGEKVASATVAAVMKGKTAFGMGMKKRKRKIRNRRGRRNKIGGILTFNKAIGIARNAIKKGKNKSLFDATKTAYKVLKKYRRKIKFPKRRVIPIPKHGGFLPLIPLFAALGALGSLGGGAAAIAKAVNDAKNAKEQQREAARHNRVMEAKAMGSGFYIKPYKRGCGLYFPESSKN